MSRFLEDAEELFDSAIAVRDSGSPDFGEWTVLVRDGESLQLIAQSDWPLEALARERGATRAYRISRQGTLLRVEGRAGSQTCLLASEKPEWAARRLLADRWDYKLIPA